MQGRALDRDLSYQDSLEKAFKPVQEGINTKSEKLHTGDITLSES